MTEEQKARWLEMATENGTNRQPAVFKKTPSPPPEFIFTENQYFNLCATVAREVKREALEEMREWVLDQTGDAAIILRFTAELTRRIAALEDET